jgi:hypothetical protein
LAEKNWLVAEIVSVAFDLALYLVLDDLYLDIGF